MRKTKIICTIGPASENEETLTQMCLAGMNVARLNFSHGTHAEHERKIELVKRVRQKLGLPIAIMLDTKGPEYRIGTFASGKVEVKTGDSFTFTTQDVAGDETKVSVNYKNLHKDLKPGNTVTVNNGIVQFEVESIENTEIHCKCLAGGTLSDRKRMSFPNKVMSGPYISQQDRSDILFGIAHGVDYVAASFVSTKQDVLDIRKLLDENGGSDIEIVAKIENRSGVDNVEEICSVCGGIMKHVGTGTQKVEEELHDLFPGTEVLRMDADTAAGRHEQLLDKFEREQIPILLGTQMVAKGLDFENVTLVGVLAADLSLYVDHYRASERTFSLITQVVGRAGRGSKEGRAVIQTYTPENDVILAAARQDYDRFYDAEIRMRRLRRDPPFADQFMITVTGPEETRVRRACGEIQKSLCAAAARPPYSALGLEILGPAPCPVVKVNNRFRYRVTVIGKNERTLRALIAAFMKEFTKRPENRGMHIFTDCNLMG